MWTIRRTYTGILAISWSVTSVKVKLCSIGSSDEQTVRAIPFLYETSASYKYKNIRDNISYRYYKDISKNQETINDRHMIEGKQLLMIICLNWKLV